MKKIISTLAIIALVLCLFVGCGSDSTVSDNGSSGVDDGIFSTSTVNLVDTNGESVYTLVRWEQLSDDANNKALQLFSAIRKELGITSVKNIADTAADGIDSYEILIGHTNRPESKLALDYLKAQNNGRSNDYIIATIGKKIVINAFCDKALIEAISHFQNNYLKASIDGGIKHINLTDSNFADVKINGVHLSEFKLVKQQYNGSYLAQMQIDELVKTADDTYAYLLDCINDKQAAGEYELIVGNANRDGVSTIQNKDEYKITVSGKKVYLNGGSPEATAIAVSEFTKLLSKGNITDADSVDGSYSATVANYDKSKFYTHSWGDDFDGTAIDTTKWFATPEGWYSNPGMNDRLSIRTTDPNYVYVSDGYFHIDAGYTHDKYIGGMLMTYNNMVYRYGFLEMSAILPYGDGLWTALWVDSRGHSFDIQEQNGIGYGAEIDVNECFGNANVIAANVHKWPTELGTDMGLPHTSLDGSHGNDKKHHLAEGETFNDTFHTFGFLWTDEEHTFTCDGEVYFSYKNNETEEDRDGLHLLSFIRLSAAIGFESQGVIIPDDDPAWQESNKLIVDNVHIYQLQDDKHLLYTK